MTVAEKTEVQPLIKEMMTASCSQLLLGWDTDSISQTATVWNTCGSINESILDGDLLNRVVTGERNQTPESQWEGVEHLGARIQPGGRIH